MRTLLILVLAAATFAGCLDGGSGTEPTPTTGTPTTTPTPGGDGTSSEGGCTSTTDASKSSAEPVWVLETSMGTVRVTLHCDKTPLTGQHFVKLTEEGYFDGTKFHRVIGPAKSPPNGFMNQGGDPLTKDESQKARWGTGGPGYTIKDEFYCADGTVTYSHPADCPLGLKHDTPGVLSMANTGRPETGGSQFFLTVTETPWLDGKHAVFGHVADDESMQIVYEINRVPTDASDRPLTPVVIDKATISW